MLFNSYVFWTFFAVVAVLYRILPHRMQNRMLLIASYVFYGWWDWRFLSLILVSTLTDYYCALMIDAASSRKRRKLFCAASIIVNLGLLGFFKYFNFFAVEMQEFLSICGLNVSALSLEVVLPVGISFYTFQTMGYTIDVFRGETEPEHDFLNFALYVAFFPQLVAGPIERSSRLLPQIRNPRKLNADTFSEGLALVLTGLFRKIVIADNMGRIVDAIFAGSPDQLTGVECWTALYAFAFQIYGDFSGYSAIARGVARWLGFELTVNFRAPYLARSPREFWQRWHISLSTWLRDYLYIPMGGSRCGSLVTLRNLLVVMVLGGLWHGAAWTFMAWGLFHALLLIGQQLFSRLERVQSISKGILDVLGIIVTFHLVCIGWLFFRADSIHYALDMLLRMCLDYRVTSLSAYGLWSMFFFCLPVILFDIWQVNDSRGVKLAGTHWFVRGCVYSYMVLMLMCFHAETVSDFIYFRF